jgi:hypothetical protein
MAKKDNKGTSSNKVILDKKNGKGKHKKKTTDLMTKNLKNTEDKVDD